MHIWEMKKNWVSKKGKKVRNDLENHNLVILISGRPQILYFSLTQRRIPSNLHIRRECLKRGINDPQAIKIGDLELSSIFIYFIM